MDPAAYARHHGVQSESHKVTVTRVAWSELHYRREVDSYKRDMKATLNSIRREQKKLRAHMRSYRRKLGGEKGRQKKKMAEEFKDTDLQGEDEHNERSPSPTKRPKRSKEEGHTDWSVLESAVSQGPHKDDSSKTEVSSMPSILDRLENIMTAERHVSREHEAASPPAIVVDEEDDVFSLLSDSSDDEQQEGADDHNEDIVTFRHGRFIKVLPPLTFLKTNAAYLKPLTNDDDQSKPAEISDDKPMEQEGEGQLVDDTGEEHADMPAEFTDGDNETEKPQETDVQKEAPPNEHAPTIILPHVPHTDEINLINISGDTQAEDTVRHETKTKKRKRKTGVSFGDLIRLQHTTNHKRLFSLVDRLASKNDIDNSSPPEQPASFLADPRRLAAIKRRNHIDNTHILGPTHTTYGSVFYAMKFGYVSDAEDTSRSSDTLSSARTGLSINSKVSQSTMTSVRPEDSVSRGPNLHLDPLSSKHLSRALGQKLTLSDPGVDRFRNASEDDTATELSGLIGILSAKLSAPPTIAAPTTNVGAPSSHVEHLERARRRSSLLEASKYVTHVRNSADDPVLARNAALERDLFQKRKPPHTSAHLESAARRKESWSSAFSRIKHIHSLVEPSHVV